MTKTNSKETSAIAATPDWGAMISEPEPISGFVRVGRSGVPEDIPKPIRAAFDNALADGGTYRVALESDEVRADFRRLFKKYGRLLGDPTIKVRMSVHPPYVDYRVTRVLDEPEGAV